MQGDPAQGDQCTRQAEDGAVGNGLAANRGQLGSALRLLDGEHSSQAGQRRHQGLHVLGPLSHRDGLLEAGSGHRTVASLAVDLSQHGQRLSDSLRLQLLVQRSGRFQFADGLVQPAEPEQSLATVVQSQCTEHCEACAVRQLQCASSSFRPSM